MLIQINAYQIIDFNEIEEINVYTKKNFLDNKKYDEFVKSNTRELQKKLLFSSLDAHGYRVAFAQILDEAQEKFGDYIVAIRISIKDDVPTHILFDRAKDENEANKLAEEVRAVIKKTLNETDFSGLGIIDFNGVIEKFRQEHKSNKG